MIIEVIINLYASHSVIG